ncbi:hypothetical protein JANAI62_05480 [Jannaschia pagri]|uniref:Sarcosine oxidase subunit gamma n=1 Tax=Jannaschia pagri TaxID=2829797 RepID=A0ABQ4NHN5_9RHOB|nr:MULTISPECIES: sarcosine oxidase subunit gamma [unclassified Jannaschia]GIT89968.1 hypothetical protein JANAI61_04260 [Jannaschia sp. AI_61]GIT93925.1 hypothetical protein JANAI62_05480 [Jannaschia sp. AI_62]
MTDLTAHDPAEDLLPLHHGDVRLSTYRPEAITSLMPLRGAAIAIPDPGRAEAMLGGLLLWSGRNQGMLLGPPPANLDKVAMTDQSDAWTILRLEGPGVDQVLSRLTPLDLNPAIFKPGRTARSLLGHMNALFHRRDAEIFDIWVFRSMAGSAIHDIERAMRGLAARQTL